MSQPTTNTNGILVTTAGSVATPAAGYVTYYFNSDDSDKLYYKKDDGTSAIATSTSLVCDPCLCETAAKTMCTWDQALLDGTLTATTYLELMTAGVTFTCSNGVDTQTLTIGTSQPVSETIFALAVYANDAAAGVGGVLTGQLYQTGGGVVMIKQ